MSRRSERQSVNRHGSCLNRSRQPRYRLGRSRMTPMESEDADLRDLVRTLSPSARDDLRRVLIRDQADRDAISSQLLATTTDPGGDQALGDCLDPSLLLISTSHSF
jgi:hypothetical protein